VRRISVDARLIPELNLITLGHVDHGKTTLTEALSGKWAAAHSEEIKRGITLRLGYADVTIYYCQKCDFYCTSQKCPKCFSDAEPQRTFSIVDAPGHETLMATVLSGSALADGALFVIAANEPCPQPQTQEHLMVLDIVGIDKIVIIQNKIDLVSEEDAKKNYQQIKEFVRGTVAENAPIIPVSAQQRINIEFVLRAIQEYIPTPKRNLEADPKFLVARSFDVNKPGTEISQLKGGVLGGSVVRGKLEVGQEIEVLPGIQRDGKWQSLRTTITSLQKAGKNLSVVTAGGLVGLGTKLDPFLTKSDSLAGSVVGLPEKLPPIRNEIKLKIHLLERVIGGEVKEISKGEILLVVCGVTKSVGIVEDVSKEKISLKLKLPVVCEAGEKIAISRKVIDKWRLIGWGEVIE
jgi:translation initiation factor 2 subunit 3